MRILGIDYGIKHTGIALGEKGNTLPLDTISTTCIKTLTEKINQIVKEESIELIVVGLPTHINNKQEKITTEFIQTLEKEISVKIITVDEKNTSKEAFKKQFTKHSSIKKINKKIHKLSAEEILHKYYNQKIQD